MPPDSAGSSVFFNASTCWLSAAIFSSSESSSKYWRCASPSGQSSIGRPSIRQWSSPQAEHLISLNRISRPMKALP